MSQKKTKKQRKITYILGITKSRHILTQIKKYAKSHNTNQSQLLKKTKALKQANKIKCKQTQINKKMSV